MIIRPGTHTDLPFLSQMLFEAFFWNPEAARPGLAQFLQDPEFQLLDNWGRRGDYCLISEKEGIPVAAAWYRLWTAENHSYGYLDDATPELGMAVHRPHRSMGIGRALLKALCKDAIAQGFSQLSLSVDPSNFALHLYESEGFQKVGESGTSWTYAKHLSPEARAV